jgi:hypothetical protein
MLDVVTVSVNSGRGYLSNQPPLGFLVSNLGTVQRSLGTAHQADFDALIEQVTDLKQKAAQ